MGGGECHTLFLLYTPSYGKDPSMGTNEPLKTIYNRMECSKDLWISLGPELCGGF